MTWEQFYDILKIKDFIYFISDPKIQEMLLPVKMVFIFFAVFFLAAVIYFLTNSSYLKYKFLEDVTEFFSWQAYGLKEISNRWKKIQKRAESGIETELKLAIIEADDFLSEMLDSRGFEGKTFDEMIKKAGRIILPNQEEVLAAHKVRNSIVYDSDFKLTQEQAKKTLSIFENAVKSIGIN